MYWRIAHCVQSVFKLSSFSQLVKYVCCRLQEAPGCVHTKTSRKSGVITAWGWCQRVEMGAGGAGGRVAEGRAVENIKWRLKWTETSSSSQLLGPGGWCDCAGVLVRSYSTQNIQIFLKTGGVKVLQGQHEQQVHWGKATPFLSWSPSAALVCVRQKDQLFFS